METEAEENQLPEEGEYGKRGRDREREREREIDR